MILKATFVYYTKANKGHNMNREQAIQEIARLRNRHVAKLLTYLGNPPEYLQASIKHSMSMFADDVIANIVENSEHKERDNDGQKS